MLGFAGDGIGEILEALRRDGGGIRFITVRHEESAAFVACAYAKLTGRVGVCKVMREGIAATARELRDAPGTPF
jgi:thiamine pyrophosphate-dependent acetolactate synthase large subunit-like protein